MALNIDLLRKSFNAIRPHALEFVEHFYEELFSLHPEARRLFNEQSMGNQYKALAASLAHVVDSIENTKYLTRYLQKMGRRHLDYSITEEQFEWVGEALLKSFSFYFDHNWTTELADTWSTAFGFIATDMKKGMKSIDDQKKKILQEPTINEIAQKFAHDLFRKAINEEVSNPAFQELVKKHAQEVLRSAVEAEVDSILSGSRERIKAA